MITVLVTGSRTWDDAIFIEDVLDAVLESQPDEAITLKHGACPQGADAYANRWAYWRDGVKVQRFPASWALLGRSAGIRRNEQMVLSGADLCLAFIRDSSKGASHCARIAEAHGIETRIFRWEGR